MTKRIATCVFIFALNLAGQSFEVASVKPSQSRGKASVDTSPGGLTIDGSLSYIVRWAYGLKGGQLSAPAWAGTERYHIAAKSPGPGSVQDLKGMLQTLLAERFKLAFHRETKELSVYALVVAKGGPNLKESDREGESTTKTDPKRPGSGGTQTRTSMAQFADLLDGCCGLPVVDLTGLKGRYDFTLDISSYMVRDQVLDTPGVVSEALQKQLGLNIVERKILIEMMVVDHAEKIPIEN